jgi:hypothetical protein
MQPPSLRKQALLGRRMLGHGHRCVDECSKRSVEIRATFASKDDEADEERQGFIDCGRLLVETNGRT